MSIVAAKETLVLVSALAADEVQAFKAGMRGPVIGPTDPGYDEARKLYSSRIDKRPGLIAYCADVADVIHCVNFARTRELSFAVRCGSHSLGGFSLAVDGLVIDLSRMRGIRVDPVARTVRVDGGCVWGDVDHATHAFGMAAPSGIVSTTGVGGLTLGGGLGYLTRKYGMTVDNLLEADVVLADGSVVTASAEQHADLFWALRGGGGNFGVVTSFLFKLHPVHTVYGGPIAWPIEQMREVMAYWRDHILHGPEDVGGWFGLHIIPPEPPWPDVLHNMKVCMVAPVYTGPVENGPEVFKALRAVGTPVLDLLGPIPWPILQSMNDAGYPHGLRWYSRTHSYTDLTDAAIELHVKYGTQMPSTLSLTHFYPVNGAAHRVGASETAWSNRNAAFVQVISGVDRDPATDAPLTQWVKDYWLALHSHSTGGAYVNFFGEEGADRVKSAYGENYARLAQVKAKYDPANLFRMNQNIKPATGS